MKNITLILGIIILFSCGNSNKGKVIPSFHEKELSFLHLRFGYSKENKWIKNPENILMLHETFKKVGYANLINEEEWTANWNWYLNVKRSPKSLIDGLELTFSNSEESPKYYHEFWQRRKKEGNEEVVYQVVKEIQQIMIGKTATEVNKKMVNDTLEQLIYFEFPKRKLSNEEANKQLEYLINIGLHESVYNLISGENLRYENVTWNRKTTEIIEELNKSKSNQRPWFEDDTK